MQTGQTGFVGSQSAVGLSALKSKAENKLFSVRMDHYQKTYII